MIKAVLFDIDDTLCDSEGAYRKAEIACFKFINKKFNNLITRKRFFEVLNEAKEEVHEELYNSASSHNRWLYFQRFNEKLGLRLKPEILEDVTSLYWNVVLKNIKPFKNVKKIFRIIKENHLQIAVVSDLLADIQIRKLSVLGLSGYIDFLITSEEASAEKPSKKIFLLALRKLECKSSEVIMVGDDPKKDIEGAGCVGIKTVLVKSFRKPPEKKKYDFFARDISQLIGILKLKTDMKKERKIIVFDLMGVIIKEPHIIRNVLYPMLKRRKIIVSYDIIKKNYEDYSINKISREQFWRRVGFDKIPTDIEKKFLDRLKLYPSFIRVIKRLKNRYRFVILSNIPREWGDYLKTKYKLNRIFASINYSGYYGMRKPDKRIYQKLMTNLGNFVPENYYFVDDKLQDLQSGKNLMMKTIWFRKEHMEITFIPDYVIKSSNELLRVLR